MSYVVINPTRYDAESPITESLMTDIIGNIEATHLIAEGIWTPLTGSGTYTVPSGVTKLRVIAVSGGGGGGGGRVNLGNERSGGGGGGGRVHEFIYEPSPSEISSGVSYTCGAGGAGGAAATDGASGGNTTFGTQTINGGALGKGIDATGGNSTSNNDFYAGGIGGNGTVNTSSSGGDGKSFLQVHGIIGDGGGISGGGGGGPISLSFSFDGVEDYLGNGGNGGTGASANGSNATTYGAGGGGGAYTNGTGGNGSAGVIFIQPLTA